MFGGQSPSHTKYKKTIANDFEFQSKIPFYHLLEY